jgi:hypothetical protein
MSTWFKMRGTQTGEIQLAFDGPILQKDTNDLIVRNAANTANANITAGNIIGSGVFYGNGSGLTNIVAGNISGQVGNALVAGTVYDPAQPNITSVGTLTSVSVTGNAAVGNILTDGYYYANGQPVDFQQAAGNSGEIQFNVAGDFGASANLLWDNTNNIFTATLIQGNGAYLTDINGANVSGQIANALVAETVSNAAQPNITSVGILTSLDVSGNAVITGNLVVSGNLTYVNVQELAVEDPLVSIGGGANNTPLTTNDGKDRGAILHYYTTQPVDAFMGWDTGNGEFALGSNVSVLNDVVTFNSFGNIRLDTVIGNLDGTANIANTAYSVDGANVVGQVGNALVAGTVYDPAQPNITSLGTLANLNVNGLANLSSVGNITITGGNSGDILTTDGAGNLSFVAPVSGASAWKVDSTTIAFNSAATVPAMLLPANAIVDKVSVIVDTAFNGTNPTLSVGLVGGTGLEYAGVGDTNLKVTDRYDIPSQLAAQGSNANIEVLYTADGSSAGSARVLVTYAIPE